MKTSEILYKAADVLRERGHYKGQFVGPHGEVCATGALRQCPGYYENEGYAYEALREYVESTGPWGRDESGELAMHPVVSFNDAPETTAEDVLLAFKHAAHAAEETENA